ncbi:hypothetical protein EV128_12581 [Rhizobium azibense]|nr:hypothetical protein EV128_12581 [Rhizobium azibense]
MISQPQLTILPNAGDWMGACYFKIQMTVPGEIGAVISEALQEGSERKIAAMPLEISDYEFQNEELLWADLWINHVPVSFMRNDDGSFLLTMTCEKGPEGDDQLDVWAHEEKMDGKLPELFWIEPANLIRALIAAVKH